MLTVTETLEDWEDSVNIGTLQPPRQYLQMPRAAQEVGHPLQALDAVIYVQAYRLHGGGGGGQEAVDLGRRSWLQYVTAVSWHMRQ